MSQSKSTKPPACETEKDPIAQRLKEAIHRKGELLKKRDSSYTKEQPSQKDVAEAVRVSQQSIGYYTQGQRIPDAKTLRKLAEYLETTTDYLTCRTADPEIHPAAADVTGLSPEAVKSLQEVQPKQYQPVPGGPAAGAPILLFLNQFLESTAADEFQEFTSLAGQISLQAEEQETEDTYSLLLQMADARARGLTGPESRLPAKYEYETICAAAIKAVSTAAERAIDEYCRQFREVIKDFKQEEN